MDVEKLPISLCLFVKNEERNIRDCIESVFPVISEVVILDTGSTDNTLKLAEKYSPVVYKVGFSDFGSIRTLSAHLASQEWVLMLDADERLSGEDWPLLKELINQKPGVQGDNLELTEDGTVCIDSWALPRKRWADRWMRVQEDKASFPDWQVRLFRNHPDKRIGFRRRVHETVYGCIRTEHSLRGPTINHFQNCVKTKDELKARATFYKKLYDMDLAEGIEHSDPPVIEEDDVK